MTPLRRAAADAAAADAASSGVPDLVARLVATDPGERVRAAAALGARLGRGPADDAEGASAALLARVGRESDPQVRDAVLLHLARYDRVDVTEALAAHLGSDDAALRSALVGALAAMPESFLRIAAGLLAHQDPDVRILVVMVLGVLPGDGAVPLLQGVVEADPDANVTAAAIGELVTRLAGACEPVLLLARERFPTDPFITYAVTQALTLVDLGPR